MTTEAANTRWLSPTDSPGDEDILELWDAGSTIRQPTWGMSV
jgi:hypothetical protein